MENKRRERIKGALDGTEGLETLSLDYIRKHRDERKELYEEEKAKRKVLEGNVKMLIAVKTIRDKLHEMTDKYI